MNQIRDDEVPLVGRDPDLLEVFYREHSATVKAFFVRRVDDPHLVADLIADTFLAAMTGAAGYRPDRGRPIAWLLGIARNTLAEASRRQARRLRAESRIVGRRLLDEDAVARIEERIAAEAYTRALYAGLDQLTGRDRTLMELVVVDGIPVTEAAVPADGPCGGFDQMPFTAELFRDDYVITIPADSVLRESDAELLITTSGSADDQVAGLDVSFSIGDVHCGFGTASLGTANDG